MGVNLDTGNFGFLTNYENKKFQAITDSKYRKGNLLMNFLRNEIALAETEQIRKYLELFLTEGDYFNGTNIWLGNLLDEKVRLAFAHN